MTTWPPTPAATRAEEAHDEVARPLARGEALGLTPPERETLDAGLAQLSERLAATR